MEIARIEVGRTTGACTRRGRIPAGIVGASVQVSFTDSVWDNLIKTVVFRGKETRIAEFDGTVAVIPHEVVAEPGVTLFFGIFGHDPDSDLQIPLIEVRLGTTEAATDADADPGTDPTLPIWAQLQQAVEQLKQGGGDPGTPGKPGEDGGWYTPAVTQPEKNKIQFDFTPSKEDMPAVNPIQVKLPEGPGSGGNANQGTENANLPMIVGEDGNVAPSKLTPNGIVGSFLDSSANMDLTISWKDGYYVTNPANGKDGALATISYGTTSTVVPGIEYEFTTYTDPETNGYTAVTFFNSEGKSLRKYETKPYYDFTYRDTVNNIYRVIAPDNAAYAKYNVYTTEKSSSYFRKATNTYSLDWLVVTDENVAKECKDAIAEHTKDYLNAGRLKYGHSLKKPFDFSGKSLVAFGDSITAGVSSPGLVSVDSYAKRFAGLQGMTYINRAITGTHILDEEDAECSIYKRISGWTGTADFAIIAGGINDYSNGKTLGAYEDTADTLSFYGSLRKICDCLTQNHPDTTVIFITPINCTHTASNATNPLNDYRNAIFEIATLYGFNVVDGSQLGFPSETGGFQTAMLEDGVHPTDAGHDFYAKNLCGALL